MTNRLVEFATLIRIEATQVVAAPPDDVFDFVADVRNAEAWHGPLTDVELVDAGPVRRGSAFRAKLAGHGDLLVTVIKYQRPWDVRLRIEAGDLLFKVSIGLARTGAGGTAANIELATTPLGNERWLTPVRRHTFRRALERAAAEAAASIAHVRV